MKQRPTTAKPFINQKEIQELRELDWSQISHFIVLTELGKGSYGVVYKVKSIINQQIYVLKKINIAVLKRPNDALKEAQLLRKLNHPNIIKYYASFIEGDYLCIIMEYAEGGDLQRLLKKKKEQTRYFTEEQVWKMAKELLSALNHIHEKNIIHRDIKTLNVFLTKENDIKLGDLGVSKHFNSEIALQGTRVGTPLYLSPELVQHRPYDYKVDVWALGCVLYHISALEPPFVGENLIALGFNIVNKMPKQLPPHYSMKLQGMIRKMLEKDSDIRPNSGEVIKQYFENKNREEKKQMESKKDIKEIRPYSSNASRSSMDQIHRNQKVFKLENLIVYDDEDKDDRRNVQKIVNDKEKKKKQLQEITQGVNQNNALNENVIENKEANQNESNQNPKKTENKQRVELKEDQSNEYQFVQDKSNENQLNSDNNRLIPRHTSPNINKNNEINIQKTRPQSALKQPQIRPYSAQCKPKFNSSTFFMRKQEPFVSISSYLSQQSNKKLSINDLKKSQPIQQKKLKSQTGVHAFNPTKLFPLQQDIKRIKNEKSQTNWIVKKYTIKDLEVDDI